MHRLILFTQCRHSKWIRLLRIKNYRSERYLGNPQSEQRGLSVSCAIYRDKLLQSSDFGFVPFSLRLWLIRKWIPLSWCLNYLSFFFLFTDSCLVRFYRMFSLSCRINMTLMKTFWTLIIFIPPDGYIRIQINQRCKTMKGKFENYYRR